MATIGLGYHANILNYLRDPHHLHSMLAPSSIHPRGHTFRLMAWLDVVSHSVLRSLLVPLLSPALLPIWVLHFHKGRTAFVERLHHLIFMLRADVQLLNDDRPPKAT